MVISVQIQIVIENLAADGKIGAACRPSGFKRRQAPMTFARGSSVKHDTMYGKEAMQAARQRRAIFDSHCSGNDGVVGVSSIQIRSAKPKACYKIRCDK